MLRLDNDVKSLRSFANRAYGSEISLQKTILKDLMGGTCRYDRNQTRPLTH